MLSWVLAAALVGYDVSWVLSVDDCCDGAKELVYGTDWMVSGAGDGAW